MVAPFGFLDAGTLQGSAVAATSDPVFGGLSGKLPGVTARNIDAQAGRSVAVFFPPASVSFESLAAAGLAVALRAVLRMWTAG
jgi:hypothetical protein